MTAEANPFQQPCQSIPLLARLESACPQLQLHPTSTSTTVPEAYGKKIGLKGKTSLLPSYPEGGLGDAVLDALAGDTGSCIRKLAVRGLPRSGAADKLRDTFGISAGWIILAVKEALEERVKRKSA